MRLTISALLLSLLTCCATGAAYYVSPVGDDKNSGESPAAPWRTITKANTSAAAQATVYLRGGTYRESTARKQTGRPALNTSSSTDPERGMSWKAIYLRTAGCRRTKTVLPASP
jgi:hypothetical protein